MPVNLKLIPAQASGPRPPAWWIWLLLLVVMLLGGMTDTILSNISQVGIDSDEFWMSALELPALLWLILLALRIAWYSGQLATAQRQNNDRERLLRREIQRGRRYLNIIGMSIHSALRAPEDIDGTKQWDALLGRAKGLKTQPSWKSYTGVRHSQLMMVKGESARQLLSRGLKKTLGDLSGVLSTLPDETPLALLLESDCGLPEIQVEEIWQESWDVGQIRQSVTRIAGQGLTTVDQWLDDSRNERSMLMIIAIRVRPEQVEGSAESIVGLLLAGEALPPKLVPLARLHRPEMMYHTGADDFQYALKQSMAWVPVAADEVKSGVLVGVKPVWHMAIATGLQAIQSPINTGQDLHDLGNTLGYPGPAAPWVAITCAARVCQRGDAQLIISGDEQANTPLWVTMVTSAKIQQA